MYTRPSFTSLAAAVALGTAIVGSVSVPAHAVPDRYADEGTILWCEGPSASLTAISTTKAGTFWSANMSVGEAAAFAGGTEALYDGTAVNGTFPTQGEDGEYLGNLSISGTIEQGPAEVLSGWDVDDDGRRYRTEGARAALGGTATLNLQGTTTDLECSGWAIDTETFVLNRAPGADAVAGWQTDSYSLPENAGSIGFYGEHQHELGLSLDFSSPTYTFGGERLQIRNGAVDGVMPLRDPGTWAVVGVARAAGTVTKTGREQRVETGIGYRRVTDLVHYTVRLTITTSTGSWSGTWPATHETVRTRAVTPPKSLQKPSEA